jgi:hypothetical protein
MLTFALTSISCRSVHLIRAFVHQIAALGRKLEIVESHAFFLRLLKQFDEIASRKLRFGPGEPNGTEFFARLGVVVGIAPNVFAFPPK